MSPWMKWTAASVLVLVIGVAVWRMVSQHQEQKEQVVDQSPFDRKTGKLKV